MWHPRDIYKPIDNVILPMLCVTLLSYLGDFDKVRLFQKNATNLQKLYLYALRMKMSKEPFGKLLIFKIVKHLEICKMFES
jgi:hypothetical protein